jgi:hypothetical protein
MMLRSNRVRELKLAPDLATSDEQNIAGFMCAAERKCSDTANTLERLYVNHGCVAVAEKIRCCFR